ncbi:MAG: amidase, partial [Acidimicrobiales bacterium]
AAIVEKTNRSDLCSGITGINGWRWRPVNSLDPARIPGGSSSGSAVAVAEGTADVGLGTDTGGSVRIPAACCGIVGLKTTWGRVPLDGVWPLSPSLDTVGPLAADVDGIVVGMRLLVPEFAPASEPARTIARVRVAGVDPSVDVAIDLALRRAGYAVDDVEVPGWEEIGGPFLSIIAGEAWRSNADVVADGRDRIGADVLALLDLGATIDDDQLEEARRAQAAFAQAVAEVVEGAGLLALPTLASPVPTAAEADAALRSIRLTPQANLAKAPAISMPVPTDGTMIPASLQLIGAINGEELLVATAAVIEQSNPLA